LRTLEKIVKPQLTCTCYVNILELKSGRDLHVAIAVFLANARYSSCKRVFMEGFTTMMKRLAMHADDAKDSEKVGQSSYKGSRVREREWLEPFEAPICLKLR
jgi:hypothetical protein